MIFVDNSTINGAHHQRHVKSATGQETNLSCRQCEKREYIYIYIYIKIVLTPKKTFVSRYQAYRIVYVPDNTRDMYRGFLLGRINASDIKRLG